MIRTIPFVLLGVSLLVPELPAQGKAKASDWVQQVLLGPMSGSSKVVTRWTKSPSLSVFAATPAQLKQVAEVVKDLNQTLAKTPIKEIRLLETGDESADIRVYFAKQSYLPELAKKHNCTFVPTNWASFYLNWNKDFELQKAYVLLASDKLDGAKLRPFLIKHVAESLGAPTESPLLPTSVFAPSKPVGGPVKLGPLDQQLLRFLYNHVKPGANADDVYAAFKEHWAKS